MHTQCNPVGQIENCARQIQLRMWRVKVFCGHRPLLQHSHPQFEIAMVQQGGGVYRIGSADVPMTAGDVFVFAGNEPHWIVSATESGLELLNLQFEPQYMWSHSSDAAEGFPIGFWFHHSELFSNHITKAHAEDLCDLMEAIENEFLSQEPKYKLMVRSHLQSILVQLIRKHKYAEAKDNSDTGQAESIQRVIAYLDSNISQELSLKKLAAIASLSPSYLSAVFHRECRVSLWDYVGARRVDMAARMLLESKGNQTMLDIALACGFHNTTNFNKAFRKYMGVTPSQYKKQAKDHMY